MGAPFKFLNDVVLVEPSVSKYTPVGFDHSSVQVYLTTPHDSCAYIFWPNRVALFVPQELEQDSSWVWKGFPIAFGVVGWFAFWQL